MYEKYKIATVKHASDEIVSGINREDLSEVIYKISAREDVCVRIIAGNHDIVAGNYNAPIYRMSDTAVLREISNALQNNNEYLSLRVNPSIPTSGDGEFKDITLTRIIESNQKQIVVMVYAGLSPVNATIKTLRLQLFYISLFIIIALIVLTLMMHRYIAIPLTEINEEAKHLPNGEYESQSDADQYLEAEELNATLSKAAKEIKKADQAKRDLIANVSHDLRTPLTMIKGYGEMMIDFPTEKTDENLKVIIDETERLSYLVNDLLDLSKLEANQLKLEPTLFDLSETVKEQLQKYNVFIKTDGFEIKEEIEDDLYVLADKLRIEQVINNFVINAINYSKDDKRIEIHLYKKDGNAVFEVIDHGEGIEESKLKDIWDRYYKIDREHVRALHSSGIGLSLAKEILDLHHAEYGVESKVNVGSNFHFSLPLERKS